MHEFEIIERFFKRKIKNHTNFPLEIGDDAALISVPLQCELVTSIDTLALGVHFPANTEAYDIGFKSLAVSLSDLAAMGAQAVSVLLALTVPEAHENWLSEFAAGFFTLAEQYQVDLIGGNLTRGPLNISTVVYGWVPQGKALLRNGAQLGDDIYVTGTLGDAGLALQKLMINQTPLEPELHQQFFRPNPRLNAGIALREIANSAIDISDGLAADLEKILCASQLGGKIYVDKIPISNTLFTQRPLKEAWQLALTAGEDYELCFTAPNTLREKIKEIFAGMDCTAQCIGHTVKSAGLRILTKDDQPVEIKNAGYQHF